MSLFGESLSFNCYDAKEILLSLIVDDGSSSRGHRMNLFNPEFNYMGSFTGEHMNFNNMTCINYAAGYVAKGAADPIDQQMSDFLKEEVVFNNIPPFVVSWKQHSSMNVVGAKATKTTVRTCKLKNGQT